jgi:hypothetical protein
VKEIAERIEKLSRLDEKRRQDRERAILIDFTRPNLTESKRSNKENDRQQTKVVGREKMSEYSQFQKPTKTKQKIETKIDSKMLPQFPSQPLPKLPSEYEQFRKPAIKKHQQLQQPEPNKPAITTQHKLVNNFKNPMAKPHPTEYSQVLIARNILITNLNCKTEPGFEPPLFQEIFHRFMLTGKYSVSGNMVFCLLDDDSADMLYMSLFEKTEPN